MIRRLAVGLDAWLTRLEWAAVVGSFLIVVGLSLAQIILRNLSLFAPPWISPLTHQLVLLTAFIGAVLGVRSQVHIRLDLSEVFLPGKTVRWKGPLVSLLSAGVCGLLAHAAWRFVRQEQEMSQEIAGIPNWVFALSIPIAFLLMTVHFLLVPWLPPAAPDPAEEGGA